MFINLIPYLDSFDLMFDEVGDKIKSYKVDMKIWNVALFLDVLLMLILLIMGAKYGFSLYILAVPTISFVLTGAGYKMNRYFLDKSIEYANKNIGPPHEIIEDFLKWKEGDEISTDHFKGKYRGLDDKNRIVLEYNDEYKCLSTGYFESSSKVRNKSLRKRKKKKASKRIEGEVSNESQYDVLVDEFQKEYDRLE